ncbi:MAG TPA: redox-regulated ATPase YchF [Desulfobacteraceae bacterium]|nr:redox-regulated ATPase YchF [Desulfobacteraceae bacterium]
MKLGIFGTSQCGKSTIMAALTGARGENGEHRHTHGDIEMAMVTVPDDRIDFLSGLYHPKKTTYARIEYMLPIAPPAGPVPKSDSGIWNQLRTCDALVHVLRNFTAPGGIPPAPEKDLNDLEDEMIVSDMAVIEKRLDRLQLDRKRGKKPEPGEEDLLVASSGLLEQGIPLRTDPEIAGHPLLRGFTFLSAKPMLVIVNNDDEDEESPSWEKPLPAAETIVVRGRLEKDIAAMTPEEAAEFIEAYDIRESALDRVIAGSFRLLKRICFFTVGPDEVKAWPIRDGTRALEAAGAVHTDIMKGFIRAEVVSYQDLKERGNFQEAKKAGLVRLEGKEYTVSDGDIITFRFNI